MLLIGGLFMALLLTIALTAIYTDPDEIQRDDKIIDFAGKWIIKDAGR